MVGGICWLAVLFKAHKVAAVFSWTDYHQPCQAAVAEAEHAAEDFTRAVGVAAVGAVATSEAAEVVPHRRKR